MTDARTVRAVHVADAIALTMKLSALYVDA